MYRQINRLRRPAVNVLFLSLLLGPNLSGYPTRPQSEKHQSLIFSDIISGTPVNFFGFAPDGASVVTQVGGGTSFVKVWSTRTNNNLIFSDSISGTGTSFVGFAPDGASAAIQVGGSVPFVKVWSTRSNNNLTFD